MGIARRKQVGRRDRLDVTSKLISVTTPSYLYTYAIITKKLISCVKQLKIRRLIHLKSFGLGLNFTYHL